MSNCNGPLYLFTFPLFPQRVQVDAEYETKTLAEIVKAPVSSLQGLSERAASLLEELDIKTVGDLGDWKYCQWAEAIVALEGYEHKKSAAERKEERMLNKLE